MILMPKSHLNAGNTAGKIRRPQHCRTVPTIALEVDVSRCVEIYSEYRRWYKAQFTHREYDAGKPEFDSRIGHHVTQSCVCISMIEWKPLPRMSAVRYILTLRTS